MGFLDDMLQAEPPWAPPEDDMTAYLALRDDLAQELQAAIEDRLREWEAKQDVSHDVQAEP